MKQRFRAIERLSHTGLLRSMVSKDGTLLQGMLHDAFKAADADGSGALSGAPLFLFRADGSGALSGVLSGSPFIRLVHSSSAPHHAALREVKPRAH